MESIIEFAYTGFIMWKEVHNLISLIQDADFFGLEDLKDEGIKILISNLDSQNALDAYHLSKICNNILLKHKTQILILQNFDIVSETDEFLNLDVTSLKDILSTCPRIHYTEKFFEGILKWFAADLGTRKLHLNDIFGLVNVAFINPDKIRRVATNANILTTSKNFE